MQGIAYTLSIELALASDIVVAADVCGSSSWRSAHSARSGCDTCGPPRNSVQRDALPADRRRVPEPRTPTASGWAEVVPAGQQLESGVGDSADHRRAGPAGVRRTMPASRGTSVSRPRANTSKRCSGQIMVSEDAEGRAQLPGAPAREVRRAVARHRSRDAPTGSARCTIASSTPSWRVRAAHADPHLDRLPLAGSQKHRTFGGQYAQWQMVRLVEQMGNATSTSAAAVAPPLRGAQPRFIPPVIVGLLMNFRSSSGLRVAVVPDADQRSPPGVGQCRHCLGDDEFDLVVALPGVQVAAGGGLELRARLSPAATSRPRMVGATRQAAQIDITITVLTTDASSARASVRGRTRCGRWPKHHDTGTQNHNVGLPMPDSTASAHPSTDPSTHQPAHEQAEGGTKTSAIGRIPRRWGPWHDQRIVAPHDHHDASPGQPPDRSGADHRLRLR